MRISLAGIIATIMTVAAFAAFRWGLEQRAARRDAENVTPAKPDTVRLQIPVERVVVKQVRVPERVTEYRRDTLWRERLCDTTLVAGITLKPGKVLVDKIDADGSVRRDLVRVPVELRYMAIDAHGNIEAKPKRKFWRRTAKTIGTVGLVAVGIGIGLIIPL
jgi:hypothetical protein